MMSAARSTAAWVFSVFSDRSRTTMMQLYKSLVRSKVEYCCPLWNPTNIADIMAIESLQRTFTSKINGVQHLTYWERLKKLNLMSLQRRRERYTIIHMWKIRMLLTPNDLNIIFYFDDRRGIRAVVPKSPKSHIGTVYHNSFAVKGPQLWNILPRDISLIDTLESFKGNLDKILLNIEDIPPISGNAAQIANSLLDKQGQINNSQLLGGRLHSTLAQ